jgi:hypothetical protein
VREGLIEYATETTGAYLSASAVEIPTSDGVHYTAAGYERVGRRKAQAHLFRLSEVASGATGPRITSASRESASADIRLVIDHEAGTALEEADGSTDGGSLTGFQVSDDDFSTTLTISSTAFDGNEVVLTLSVAPADEDTIKVRYQYGEGPTVTNPVYDDTTPQGDSIGLPLLPTVGSVTAELPPTNGAARRRRIICGASA